jgi:ATP-binding cassette subfamily B protein
MQRRHLNLLELNYHQAHPAWTLWMLYKGQRKRLLWAALLYITKASPQWLTPVLIGMMVTSIAEKSDPTGAIVSGAVLLVLILLNLPLHSWYSRLLAKATRQVETDLRVALIRRMQQLSMSFHDETHSGALEAKVLRDVEAIQTLSHTFFNGAVQASALVTISTILTLKAEPWLGLLFLLVIPSGTALVLFFRGGMQKRNREFHGEVEEMNSAVSEMIDMIPVTRAHGAEDAEIQRVTNHLERVRDRGIELDIINNIFGASSWIVFQVCMLLCIGVTGYFVWIGRLNVGAMVIFPGLFGQLLGTISQFLSHFPMVMRGFQSIRSLGDVLECPDLEWNEDKKPVENVQGRFEFQHVSYAYPNNDRHAVTDFNLCVESGECIALVGESGSGKSTLISLIIGFHRPKDGRIFLDGQDMQDMDLRTYRQHLAVVPQQSILFSGTIRDNITYGTDDFSEEQILQSIETANLSEFVRDLPEGLDTRVGEGGARLSGGQRQRLAIARAVIRNPRVVLLDEATSALDVISEVQVQQAIERMIQNRTTFIVAHRLSTIRNANRIVVMKQGRCVELGTQDELMARGGEFSRLKSLQA